MSDSKEERWLDLDLAAANVNRAGTLVGSTMAVFTFLLFFLYPRYFTGQIDPVLFQVTLTIIILTILTFSLSGLFYYRIGVLKLNSAKKRTSMQRGALFWLFGTLFILLEPGSDTVHRRANSRRSRSADRMDPIHSRHAARRHRLRESLWFYLRRAVSRIGSNRSPLYFERNMRNFLGWKCFFDLYANVLTCFRKQLRSVTEEYW